MKRTIRTIMWAAVAVMALLTFQSCNKNNPVKPGPQDDTADMRLKGIWAIESFRMEGANLSDHNPLSHIIIDPSSRDFIMVSKDVEGETGAQGIQAMKMIARDGKLSVFRPGNFETYIEKPDDNLKTGEYEYMLLDNGTVLFLYIPASVFLSEDMIDNPSQNPSIIIGLHHDKALENKIADNPHTRSIWSDISSWVKDAVDVIIDFFTDDEPTHPDVNVHYDPWSNTNGWRGDRWMSLLPDKTPVCMVNIPGSHDSGTAPSGMNFIARGMNANCQELSIHDQFYNGARYFDFRVGMDFVWHVFPILKRVPNAQDQMEISDLELFHGTFGTENFYKKALTDLANQIVKGGNTEFVFINTQWENMSYGVIDLANLWADGVVFGDDYESGIKKAMSKATMDVANRLQKEVNEEFGGNLFINYRPGLTVDDARGHIILMESSHGDGPAYSNPQVSYVFSWPDNDMGYAHVCPFNERDSQYRMSIPTNIIRGNNGYNTRVQSYYEMTLDQTDKIETKINGMKTLATQVTQWNTQEGKRVLGFNAMNANSASIDLNVDDFAHKYNGKAFDMFVENMKNEPLENRFRSGIVAMDYFGSYNCSTSEAELGDVYGNLLAWAVIESNFYVSK